MKVLCSRQDSWGSRCEGGDFLESSVGGQAFILKGPALEFLFKSEHALTMVETVAINGGRSPARHLLTAMLGAFRKAGWL